jgi:hypothetical protein
MKVPELGQQYSDTNTCAAGERKCLSFNQVI